MKLRFSHSSFHTPEHSSEKSSCRQSFCKNFHTACRKLFADLRRLCSFFVVLFIYTAITQLFFHRSCPIALISGLPCPGCGITRAALYLLAGKLSAAWHMNPSIYVWLIFIPLYFFFRYYKKNQTASHCLILFAAVITLAVYIHGMAVYFPQRAPYVYNSSCLFHFVTAFFL